MNDEEQKNLWQALKCLWQEQKPSGNPALTADEQIAAMRKKMAQMHRGLNKTDFWGSALYAVVTVPFIIYVFTTPYFVTRIGYLIIVGGMLFASWKSIRRRRSIPQPIADAPVMEWLKYDLAKVRQHAEDSRTLLWWYLLPFLIGMYVSTWGMKVNLMAKIPISVLVALIAGVTYWLNQRVWRNQWLPMQQALEALLNSGQPVSEPEPPKKNIMTKIILIGIVLISLGAIVFVRAREPKTLGIEYSDPVSKMLENIRENHNLPALAVVVTKDGQICDRAAAGVRKWGDPTPVTTNDVFHIGSCTKSMTATLAAMFIEQGKLRWDTTIAEVFPELKGRIDKRYETVTVEQLLHHRGGVPHDSPPVAWKRAWKEIGTPMEQRREFIEAVLSAPPAAAPGTKMIYSNDGYVIVGVMLEKISGQDFESLMTEKLFKPLHMDTAGFGAPGTKDKIDQPWGHVHKPFMTVPMQADNPPVHSPCGRVHCSLDDLARYAMFHSQGGTNALLKPETLAKLHASPDGVEIKDFMDDYACGWVRMKRGWAGGTVLWHNGSNTMWYIVMWLAPEKNFAVIAATNIAGNDAEQACDDACVAMINKWLPEK